MTLARRNLPAIRDSEMGSGRLHPPPGPGGRPESHSGRYRRPSPHRGKGWTADRAAFRRVPAGVGGHPPAPPGPDQD